MPAPLLILAIAATLLATAVSTVVLQGNEPAENEDLAMLITSGAMSAAVAGVMLAMVGVIALLLA